MTSQTYTLPSIKPSKIQEALSHFLLPVLFIVFVLTVIPIGQSVEFDTDEGINLIKALLYSNGLSLYEEIWSDQPPLLTVLLSGWFELFGQSLIAARILILGFATLLIWSFFQILKTFIGSLSAFFGTLALIVSNKFTQLSASVMIGLPSLTLAMLSIYCLVLYKKKPHILFIILSGTALACSLQIKIFTVFLIPIMLLYLLDLKALLRDKARAVRNQGFVVAIWLGCLLGVYLLIGLTFHSINYEQLLDAHFNEAVEQSFEGKSGLSVLLWLISKDHDLVALALFGCLVVFLEKRRDGLFPILWLGTATLLLLNHKPIWYHHYTLLAIPLAWLAAYGVSPAFDFLFSPNWLSDIKTFNVKKLAISGISLLLLIVVLKGVAPKIGYIARTTLGPQEHHHDSKVVEMLKDDRPSIQWIFTDRPIYAFQADLPIPPEVAVFSLKRINSGNFSFDYLISILERYKPERLVLSRFTNEMYGDLKMSAYLNTNYSTTYKTDLVELHERKS